MSRTVRLLLVLVVLVCIVVVALNRIRAAGVVTGPPAHGRADVRVSVGEGGTLSVVERVTAHFSGEPDLWHRLMVKPSPMFTLSPMTNDSYEVRNPDYDAANPTRAPQYTNVDRHRRYRYRDLHVQETSDGHRRHAPTHSSSDGISVGAGQHRSGTHIAIIRYRVTGAVRTEGGTRRLAFWPVADTADIRIDSLRATLSGGYDWESCLQGEEISNGGTTTTFVAQPCRDARPNTDSVLVRQTPQRDLGQLRLTATLP